MSSISGIATLSSSTLVSVCPKARSANRGKVPERIVFWDVNNNGKLDAKDIAFEFYATRRRSKRFIDRCVANCSPAHTGAPIYWRRVSALDRRLYGGRSFTRKVVDARKRRSRARKVGPIAGGICYAYLRSVLPRPVSVRFNPALTLSTKLVVAPFKRTAIPKSKTISPSDCRAVEARSKVGGSILSLGGVGIPYWLKLLSKSSTVGSRLAPLLVRTIVSEAGKNIIHLGVK